MHYTDADFDHLSWHDNCIHGFSFHHVGPEPWDCNLVLDIDYIAEWVRQPDGVHLKFRVAPADLIFHGAFHLDLQLDWTIPEGLSIEDIRRRPRPEGMGWIWTIDLFAGSGKSRFTFDAERFSMTLRKPPILTDGQWLDTAER